MNAKSVLAGGILLLIYTFFHAYTGYPMINGLLDEASAGEDLTRTVRVIWVFSSFTMALCGLWALFLYREMASQGEKSNRQLIVLGLAITIFGLYGFAQGFPNWHLLSFVLPGLLILIPGMFSHSED